LRRWCHPSTSLFVRVGRIKTDHEWTGQTELVIQVFSMYLVRFINTPYCTNATIYSFLEHYDVDLGISLICSLLSKKNNPSIDYNLINILWRYSNIYMCVNMINMINKVEDRTLKRHKSIGVFVVYIDTRSSMPNIPSKSRDLADANTFIFCCQHHEKKPSYLYIFLISDR
jgi:hypothetical protein